MASDSVVLEAQAEVYLAKISPVRREADSTDLISNSSRLNNQDVKLGHMPAIKHREKN
ncbi:MAG TPA: hypothetical protein VEF33_08950 [Syntrophales bacterium]|nr:hypothetical protein [Syntrophales bacterium]